MTILITMVLLCIYAVLMQKNVSILHDALLYKLWGKVSINNWLLLHRWYKHLKASIRWNGKHRNAFSVTIGTRQGSVLSPYLFNIFLNDLLCDLNNLCLEPG